MERIEYRFEFPGPEIERLVAVAGDLEFLQTLPRDRLLTHTEVRLAANVLRRLLIDNQLASVTRWATGPNRPEWTVQAVDIDTPIAQWPERWIRYAFAGGASVPGMAQHSGWVLAVIPKAEHEEFGSPEALLEANPLPLQGEPRTATLDQFLASTSVAIMTNEVGLVRISRRSVLLYMANRKGGVHFDPKRRPELKDGKKRRKEMEYSLLDHGLLRVGHLSGPEYEVASMARAVADADWPAEIVRVAQELAPGDFNGDPAELKFWTGVVEADGTGWATSTFAPATPAPDAEE